MNNPFTQGREGTLHKNTFRNSACAGFTLVELLTVVLILGILTSIALPQYRKAVYRAETANALINLKSLYDSAKRSYAVGSVFPTEFTQLDLKFPADDNSTATALFSGGYKFEFLGNGQKGMKACRGSENNTLCLQVFYSATVGGKTRRDVYTCTANGKFLSVCENMGKDYAGTYVLE